MYLLQNGKQMVQEGALTALASVADSSQVVHELIFVNTTNITITILMISSVVICVREDVI